MRIRPIVLGVYEHGDRILLQRFWHEPDQCHFYRLPGGGIELGERAELAIRREAMEELNSEIGEPELLEIVENIFEYGAELKHEIVFIFRAQLLDPQLFVADEFTFYDNGLPFRGVWMRRADIVSGQHMVWPARFREMVLSGEI